MVNVFNGIFYGGSSGRFDVLLSGSSHVSCRGPTADVVDAFVRVGTNSFFRTISDTSNCVILRESCKLPELRLAL